MTKSARTRTPTHRLNLPDGAGRAGEAAAESILRLHGYEIVRTNFRVREGEIDLVCRSGNQFVFVEVKTRRTGSYGLPEESLSPAKAARLITTAQAFLELIDQPDADWRIDVLAIEMDHAGRVIRSNLVENAVTG